MENLVFMLWMLLFPLISEVCNLINSEYNDKEYSDRIKDGANIITIIIYIVVGILIYK